MEKEEKKNNKGLIILVIVLTIAVLGMGGYIAYDKGIIFAGEESKNSGNNKVDIEEKDTNDEIKELDLSKCLNKENVTYTDPTDVEEDFGLSMKANSDKRSVTLSIDWAKFGPHSTATAWGNDIRTYQITGFSKDVSDVFVGGLGQSAMGITLFYLMSDGTVEYTPMFIKKIDSQNNSYYVMNYTFEYSDDGRIIGEHFSTNGQLKGAKNVIKLYTVNASNGFGWITTIGATKDGSFYDLGVIINN